MECHVYFELTFSSNFKSHSYSFSAIISHRLRVSALCAFKVYRYIISSVLPPDNTPLRSSLVAESNVVELYREEPEEELGLRIVGGKDTPLGNIVIQEIVRDSVAARDGRLAPGDHILEVKETWQKEDFMGIM